MESNKKSNAIKIGISIAVVAGVYIGYKVVKKRIDTKHAKSDELAKDIAAYNNNPNSTLGDVAKPASWLSWFNPFR